MGRKHEWTTIKVPRELRDKLREVSEREDKAYWKVVIEALSFYVAQKRKATLKEQLPKLDKASWYIAKCAMSVGALKENPSEANLQYLKRTLAQIEERLGVDTKLLARVAEEYARLKSVKARVELNGTLKMLIVDIISTALP